MPAQRAFATKPELARVLLQRALEAGVPAGWVTADEVYGNSPALRGWLEGRQLPSVLAVKCTQPLPPPSGPPTPAARLAEEIPPACWLRSSAGQGAKGRRWYAWSRLPLSAAGAPQGWGRWLLVRRSLRTGELAYYVCAGPAGLPLVALVRVAGSRWRVEEAFQAGKGLCGLAVLREVGLYLASPPPKLAVVEVLTCTNSNGLKGEAAGVGFLFPQVRTI